MISLEKGEYITLPKQVFFSSLPPRQKWVLLTIYSFTSSKEDYSTTLTNSALIKATSLEERTIKKAIEELVELGFIKISYPSSTIRIITLNLVFLLTYFNIKVVSQGSEVEKSTEEKKQFNNEKEAKPNFNPKRRGCPLS